MIRIWSLCDINTDMSLEDVYRETELLTDDMLKQRLKQAIIDCQLHVSTYEKFGLNDDTDTKRFTPEYVAQIFMYDGYRCEPTILETIGE